MKKIELIIFAYCCRNVSVKIKTPCRDFTHLQGVFLC
nr:MAG TPA: hypothetical protein [Caudoviricetes sp.]